MSVRVVARIRPLLPNELDKDVIVRVDSSEEGRPPNVVKLPSPKNEAEEFSFTFNSVYDQAASQETLFNAEVAPHVKSLFQGLDLTIFAYGVTGTGKTHTMRGGTKLADRGIIPRLLSHVFRRGKKIARDSQGRTTVAVALAYYEIYNDKVFDLLAAPETRTPAGLPLRETKDGRTCVVGLSEQACASLADFERLYVAANQHRVTAATKLNAHSSRSHAILRVKVTQTTASHEDDTNGTTTTTVRESTASAIDLAGSEDNRRTDNSRARLVESAAINKSLFVLSQCVDAIARGEKRVPYRESKMTRILSLGQHRGITVMVLNLAPVRSYHLDTLSSLHVSSRTKRIEAREIENEVVFKQPPRSARAAALTTSATTTTATTATAAAAAGTSGLARQPLRALTNNAHNIQTGLAAAKAATADKPVKAFSVYTDRATTGTTTTAPPSSSLPTAASASSRMGPLANISQPRSRPTGSAQNVGKRLSDSAESRPSKLARPSAHTTRSTQPPAATTKTTAAAPQLSAEQIEAIVERKVAEALAARAQKEQAQPQQQQQTQRAVATAAHDGSDDDVDSAGQPHSAKNSRQQDVSEVLQRRLDALERRIDDSTRADDPRAEGLRCLLLARQHKEVGDDAAALRYYEQALPFFPGQAKLQGKIDKLRAKLASSVGPAAVTAAATATTVPYERRGVVTASLSPRRAQSSHKRKRAVAVSVAASPIRSRRRKNEAVVWNGQPEDRNAEADADADADVEDDDVDNVDDAATLLAATDKSPRRRPSPGTKKRKTAKGPAALPLHNTNGHDADDESRPPVTPRTRRLLDIVNSRDEARIRGLAGVGPRKARVLVDFLDGTNAVEQDGHASGAVVVEADVLHDEAWSSPPALPVRSTAQPVNCIETLAQLRDVPGLGERTVERAYEGLVAAM
ncbi:kinesin family protein [Niveomyces insectorum RCEF 264]|uniref:Kinesin family protein n=1 Tax=Niveomyces insectorum RCEF 264 TaxID=1081102 RepID=A0A167SFI3_9HYPO|nr:kinesin family protein [Niveomyces insectorum RCEF 264]